MKTHEEFIKEMREKHPNIKVVGTYRGTAEKIEWVCSECGEHQFSLPQNLLKPEATGLCRKCFNLQLASSRTKTHDQFIQELKAIHPDIKITGIFQGNNKKIEWECKNCGKKQLSFPANLLKPTKTPFCKECSQKLRTTIKREQQNGKAPVSIRQINAKRFYEAVEKKKNPPILLDDYQSSRDKIRCKCSVCGYEWSARPRDILNYKHACPRCANSSHAISNKEFIQRLAKINKYIVPLEDYKRQDQHIMCRCSRCGHEWSVTPGSLLSGNGCPRCSRTGTSFFEQLLFLSLQEVIGADLVLSRDKKAIGSELDIYIPELNLAFEYGAWYYHKNRLDNDLKKVEKCRKKGIRLIRIYDACDNNQIGGEDVVVYTKNLALDMNDSKQAIKHLFSLADIDYEIDEATFTRIIDEAYNLSRKMTTEEFKERIAVLQPDIEVLGEYKNNDSRILCKCKKCGHEWNPTAHGLLAGYGCPNCFHLSQTKDEEQFLEEMGRVNPDLELLEPYVASNKRILVRCKKCGHQWRPYASTLLHGYGCASCRKEDAAQKALSKIRTVNPEIEIIGKYQGASKPIKVRCKTCGHVWAPTAHNLKNGASHCPECSKKKRNEKLRMSKSEFCQRLADISPSIELAGPFHGANNKVDVRCKKCGYEWSPRAMDLLTGRGCRKCKYKAQAERSRRTPEQFVEEMAKINPKVTVIGRYTKANEHIEVECKTCGKRWTPLASSLLSGTGCPSCSKKRTKR